MSATHYRWQPARLWLALILYWLASMIGATLIGRASDLGGEVAWIILVMLIMVGICVFAPRQPWPWWRKVLTILGAWTAQALLQVPGFFLALLLVRLVGTFEKEKIERLIQFSAALPIVIYVMRHSRLFVIAKDSLASPAGTFTPPEVRE
jgi:hypothetical protein